MIGKKAELRTAIVAFLDGRATQKEHNAELAGIRNRILDYIGAN